MLLKRPIVTEKSVKEGTGKSRRYVFEVEHKSTKTAVKRAVEITFGVGGIKVQTTKIPDKSCRLGKKWVYRRKPDRKKAVVTLKPGEKIDQIEITGAKET